MQSSSVDGPGDWESGELGSISSSAIDPLGGLGFFTSPLCACFFIPCFSLYNISYFGHEQSLLATYLHSTHHSVAQASGAAVIQ